MEQDFVLCADKNEKFITPESILTRCTHCNCEVWCSPWNMTKKPICFRCIMIFIDKARQSGEKMEFSANPRDIQRALEFIKETKS